MHFSDTQKEIIIGILDGKIKNVATYINSMYEKKTVVSKHSFTNAGISPHQSTSVFKASPEELKDRVKDIIKVFYSLEHEGLVFNYNSTYAYENSAALLYLVSENGI